MREAYPPVWPAVPPRAWLAALSIGCFGAVAIGMILQHLLQLSPCPLCIFQRFLYLAVGVVAGLGALLPALRLAVGGLSGALGVLGLGVAAYQSWMQAYPDLAPTCSFSDPNIIERFVYWLGAEFPDWFLATGLCSSVDWQLFGLSMANWSIFFFAGIALFAGLVVRRG